MKKVLSVIVLLLFLFVLCAEASQPDNAKDNSLHYNGKTLGVLGGMGPAASAEFMRLLAAKAPATKDQEHPRVILLSSPGTPDRTAYILGKGENPEPYLKEGLQTLSGWGADVLAVTCNTAHYYLDHFAGEMDKPLVHIIDETIRESKERSEEGAWLLATFGTMQTGIYQKHARDCGYTFFVPSDQIQPDIHHMTDLVKAGKYKEAGDLCKKICKKLWKEKNVPIVAGCTEIPIAYDWSGLPAEKCVSSLEALVDGCLRELYTDSRNVTQ